MKLLNTKFNKIITTIFIVIFFVLLGGFVLAQSSVQTNGNFKLTKLNDKKDFSLVENPVLNFEFKRKQNVFSSFKEFLMSLFIDQYEGIGIEASVIDNQGRIKNELKPQIEYIGDGEFVLSIKKPENDIKPGKYKISLNIKDSEITNGETISFEQDFSWGVLAINANKAQYYTGEEAYLQMAVLDETGHTLCGAQVFLEITAPDGGVAYLNTDNGLIIQNPECGPDNIIDDPDYYAYYRLGGLGEYNIRLRSITQNGIYEINDKIEVVESKIFDIERIGPTRINPTAEYAMKIKIKSSENFTGSISEFVPASFKIINQEEIQNSEFIIEEQGARKILHWENIILAAGDELEIGYTFDAQDISPEFYLLGPLQVGKFIEGRSWQIASDDVGTYIFNAGTSVYWTNDTYSWDNTDDTYAYRDIPRRSADDSANYLEGNANGVPSNAYVITDVEIGVEGYFEDTDITVYALPRFGGTTNGSSYSISGFTTTDTDTVFWASVFSDANAPSTWTWSDVQNMDMRIYGSNADNAQPRLLYIDQMYVRVTYNYNVAPTVSFSSISQKTDGSGAVDIAMVVDDSDDDDEVRVLVEYEEGTTCASSSKATIDETDANTTSDRTTDPKVENDNDYQIGNTLGWIITSEGANTVNFDWLSDTDAPNASSTYCVSLTAYDGVEESSATTTTVVLDNYPPQISSVTFSPSSGVLKIGDTATATIQSDGIGYSAGTTTINSVDVSSSFIDNNDNTYTLVYTVAEGDTDISDLVDLPISFVLKDSNNNESSAYNTADISGRPGIDAHKPEISSVTVTNDVYKIGDTITLVITVTSDTDAYSLGVSTINNVSAQNLVKLSDTSYNLDYVVEEGDTDRVAGTIPISIVLQDTAGNENSPYTVLAANTASVDAHRPEITSLAIPSLVYKVGDTITATATVTSDTDTYSLSTTTINNVAAGNLQKINDTTYTFDYIVQEGDTDRAEGAIPISAIFTDTAGNENTAFTIVASNTASIDANSPAISSVVFNPSSGILIIGQTATATISAASLETGLLAGSSLTINSVDVSSSFTEIGGGDYTISYTVQSGDIDRSDSDDLPVNIIIKDLTGNESVAYITADPVNRPGVDANAPVISSVSFVPISGVLAVGDIATATIVSDDIAYSAGTITINGVDVSATLIDNGDNSYTVVYVVAEGNNDILDANDLPVNISLVDTNGNESAAYTTADAANRPGVDAGTPSIISVAFNPSSGLLAVGDTATATISVSNAETGLLAGSVLTINNVDVSSSFAEIGAGDYIVTYTVQEGQTDVPDANDLPVNFTIKDAASNESAAYTTADAANRPGVDAGTPSIPGNLSFFDNSDYSIIISFGATTTEADFKEYKIFYKIGTSGVTENDNEFNSTNDSDLLDINFNNTSTTTISGLERGTQYVFNIWAYDNAGNKSSAVLELSASTNYSPSTPGQLDQLKDDGLTSIPNGNWTEENSIKFTATSTDPESELLTLYYEFVPVASSFTLATTVPSSACGAVETYANCTSKIWSNSGGQIINITSVPDSSTGYKWQAIACDNKNSCSEWSIFNAITPNVKVDNTQPSAPGSLVEFSKDSTSVILTFGTSTVEDNFSEYKIFYKVGSSSVTELDSEYSSSSDSNLGFQDYNSATSTIISSLSAGTQYVVNIWAYDEAGNKASGTEITFVTDSASNPPTGVFNSVAEKIDGSGAIDISVEIDDLDNDNTLRLKIEYVSGASCDFSTPLDPTLDETNTNITADYGDPAIDNNYPYQVGTSSAYIWTSFGSNTVNFDWLSAIDLPDANGVYCLRLTANDGQFDQSVSATTTIYIDNFEPTVPGNLTLNTKNTNDLILNFGSASVEDNFSEYKIFYKTGTSGVTESDNEHIDSNLSDRLYNGAATTSIFDLSAGTDYVFNIYAYDDYGNKSNAVEQSFTTNFIPGNPSSLEQKKNDNITIVANSGWTDEDNLRLSASASDSDTSEVISLYFEMRPIAENFLTATSVPANPCATSTSYAVCTSKVWSITSSVGDYSAAPFTGQVQPSFIPDSTVGYKWQVMACDDNDVCSSWIDAGSDPNFKIDTIDPSVPGDLSLFSRTYDSLTLNFGSSSVEANFKEYIIYYKEGSSGVGENDTIYASSSDANLSFQDYNSASNTTISGLLENTQYVINIYAYDEVGRKASATELVISTNNRPSGDFLASSQRTDGSGVVDISIEVSDTNSDDSRAKLEYVSGLDCDFSSPLDPTLDGTDANATSTYGDAKIVNTENYQIGSSSGWIITSSGTNQVAFDWLSQSDIPLADDNYCLRLTANDQFDDQAVPATTTLIIDNNSPSAPGDLQLYSSDGNSITLSFGATSTETHFSYYKIFYKEGIATVNENDTEHIDNNLNDILYNNAATTTISSLSFNTQYSFKIYAYDSYGNKSSSGQTTYTTNAPPTGDFNSIAEKTDGSGIVDVSIEVYDINLDDCMAKIEYVAGSACDFTTPLNPSLDETQANITADYGVPTILNSSSYQIGSSTKIITNQGSNTINFDWLATSDIGGQEGVYCLRLTVNDGLDDQAVLATSSFFYDNIVPIAPGDLTIGTVTGVSVELNYGLAGSDTNFKEYKIFYKQGLTGVSDSDTEFNKNDDINLGVENFNNAVLTTIDNLTQNTDYVFNIWIYDDYGNVASATNEVASSTIIIQSATWREAEDTPDPTLGNYLARQENIRLRIDIANSGDSPANAYRYDLEYGIKAGACNEITSWTTVPVSATTEHFSFVTSQYFNNLSSTTPKLSNSGGYASTSGYIVESPSNITGYQDIAGGEHAEMEYVIQPTANAIAGTSYCFRSTNNGDELDLYLEYPVFTIAPLPTSSFVSVWQKNDGTEAVDISFEAYDANGEDSRAKLEYVLGADCNFTTPLDPTIDETDANVTATYGDPVIDNNYSYQVGTTSGWIVTSYGTTTVNVDWDTLSDLSNADDVYCLRLTFNDGYDDQTIPATTTVIVDHINPTTPGYLSEIDISSNSVTLGLGTSSVDTNFKEYKIYYKEGSSGVTESDLLWASSSDANLGFANYNSATTTTVTGLTVNKQYVFQIWAYDKFGHKAVASQELVVDIRYVTKSENWRWYADQQNETPTTTLAVENVAPIDVTDGAMLKLRLALREIENIAGENIKIRLQYSTYSDFSDDVNFVGEIGSTTAIWRYGDGVDDDNDPIITPLLNGISSGATHNESGISTTTYTLLGGTAAEWEFTLRNNGGLSGNTYYFRAYDNTNQGPIETNIGSTYPSILISSPNLSYSIDGYGIGSSTEGVVTTVSSSFNNIDFGTLSIDNDEIAAQKFTIDTNAGGGYQLFVYQRQNMIAGNGADINSIPFSNDSPQAWPINPDPSAFGYHAGDDTLSGSSPSRFSADNTYAAFESDYKEISYSEIPVQNEEIDFIYRIEASDMQEAGDYETEIVYILLPTFYE